MCWIFQRNFSAFLLAGALAANSTALCAADCVPGFPYLGGWLGGDAAYSLPLGRRSDLWLFGDTFVGAVGAKDRVGAAMIANSVAVSRCGKAGWEISYHWRNGTDGKPAPFFDTGLKDVRYWPLDGFLYKGRAYVALSRIRIKGTGPFDFENSGTDLASFVPDARDPGRWEVRISTLWPTGEAHLGVSIVHDAGFAYWFTVDAREGKKKRVVLARTGPAGARLEYLAQDGSWKPGFSLEEAAAVMDEAATEMTVRRRRNAWVAVYPAPGLPSPGVAVRTARALKGPWSEPKVVAPYPEPADPDVFCYAAKEQARWSTADRLAVTYACNAFKPEKLMSGLELYRPKLFFVPRPD